MVIREHNLRIPRKLGESIGNPTDCAVRSLDDHIYFCHGPGRLTGKGKVLMLRNLPGDV